MSRESSCTSVSSSEPMWGLRGSRPAGQRQNPGASRLASLADSASQEQPGDLCVVGTEQGSVTLYVLRRKVGPGFHHGLRGEGLSGVRCRQPAGRQWCWKSSDRNFLESFWSCQVESLVCNHGSMCGSGDLCIHSVLLSSRFQRVSPGCHCAASSSPLCRLASPRKSVLTGLCAE